MKLIVNPHKILIDKNDSVNEKEIKVTKVEFEFKDIPEEYVKEAYFTLDNTYKVLLTNNECDIPNEVLTKTGTIEIGCVCYLVENETEIKRYNPSPVYINSLIGSLKNATNTEPITPTDKEQMEQAIQDMETKVDNLDIEAEKVDKTTTITITKKDGTQQEVEILDGEDGVSLEYNWSGTSLGIKREDEQSYEYVNLKGDTGEPGQIEFIVVQELPTTGNEGIIYLVPITPDTSGNNYAEYIWVNNNWELLGKIGVQVDLTDYYTKSETNNLLSNKQNTIDTDHKLSSDLVDDTNKTHLFVSSSEKTTWNNKLDSSALTNYVQNTDYAGVSKAGVIKRSSDYGTLTNSSGLLYGVTKTYEEYTNANAGLFVSKGTLENVITGKGLTTKSYVDGLVGDINTALDTINGEVI